MDKRIVRPSQLATLTGEEQFSFGATVLEFWRWALGDLRMNTIRGFLAEFLVSKAVGAVATHRVEWAPFDVEAADGTRLEVKATGYLQSWTSAALTTPGWTFESVAASTMWDEALGRSVEVDPLDRVDVWVLALQTCTDPDQYQPLDADQWEFRVVPHRQLLALGQKSARLSTLDRMGITPVPFGELCDAVASARSVNQAHARDRT